MRNLQNTNHHFHLSTFARPPPYHPGKTCKLDSDVKLRLVSRQFLRTYQIILHRISPNIVLDDFSNFVSTHGVILEPREEAGWIVTRLVPLSSDFLLPLVSTLFCQGLVGLSMKFFEYLIFWEVLTEAQKPLFSGSRTSFSSLKSEFLIPIDDG